ncbi:MAG: outer membrane beta-barrel protein [Bacteroidales bacterium]|nr:outer membrane beta-barrel protein [Bacteroidales bacterium]
MKLSIKLLIAGVLMLSATSQLAQAQNITARLLEAGSKEPLPYATVYITKPNAAKPAKYVLSTSEGKVLIENVARGKYIFKAELMGYKAHSQEITVEGKNLVLGDIMIEPDSKMLEAAKVSDVGNPITVKKDTIEYNASSFKTSDNDMLIDLLKKLPGVEVEADGTITANGETIKKITIDGKTFFLDDPQLATKNIPSKIVEKVKVIEKKSDQAIFTGIDDGEEETIIDLGIKKGMMKGWFGNIMGGGGHDIPTPLKTKDQWSWDDARWQGAGFIGNFTDKQQISVILNGNNTNNRGFNDMAGSMMGNMRGGGGRGMGRFGDDSGITTSWMGGINGAWNLLDNRMDLGANYLYNGSDKLLQEQSEKNTFVNADTTLNYLTTGINRTRTQGHRLGVRLEHKFSDNTSIIFEPQFNAGYGNFSEYSDFKTTNSIAGHDKEEDVNNGFNRNEGYNKNWTASGWALLRQRLGKPGRTISLNVRYNFSNNDITDGINQSLTNSTFQKDTVNQSFTQNSRNNQLSGRIVYTEPLWKDLYLEVNYQYTWRQQTSEKETNDITDGELMSDANGLQRFVRTAKSKDRLNETYSRDVINKSSAHRAGANLMYQKKKLRAQLGFSANPTYTFNHTSSRDKDYTSNTLNWAPQASLSYDFNDNSNVRFFYNGRSEQPSTAQLVPVPDNSDPMNVSLGNPGLKPYFNHRIRGTFRYTNKKTFLSINAFFNGGFTQDPISNTTWYDNTGAQFTMLMNGPVSGNANLRLMINAPIAKSKFSIFNMLNAGYNNSSNAMAKGQIDMSQYFIDGDKFNFDYDNFLKDYEKGKLNDKFNMNNTQTLSLTERIRFTYRNDIVEVTLGARTRINKSWYTVSASNKKATFSNQADASMNWTIPGGVNLIADFRYNWYNNYTTDQQPTAVLNAEISKLLCKKKLTLSLKGYDLLGQARNLNIKDTDNYHQEITNNTLGRYIILSLTYRFGNFNKFNQTVSGQRGGRGGYGRGPMGGGPGPR